MFLIGKWSKSDWRNFVLCRLPLLRWLPLYRWHESAFTDIIGGIMISVISVPQSLAYAFLVGVPPNYGLITGFISPLIYTLFGTSKHTSPGAFAIVSLMIGSVVSNELVPQNTLFSSDKQYNDTMLLINEQQICCSRVSHAIIAEEAVRVACNVTMLVGLLQIVFGLLNVGLLAVWLSDHLVQAAIHVVTSQLKYMTGIHYVPSNSEPLGIIKFYLCFITQLDKIDIMSVAMSLTTICLLLFSSYVIDPLLKKKVQVKFPMELIVVVLSTAVVWYSQNTKHPINIAYVGEVQAGLVSPRLPALNNVSNYFSSSVTIAVVSFVIHIALAKIVSKKLNYEVDANQEWFALGAMHTISSIFGCFAGGSSLGRTMLQVKFGTKSQLSTIVCAFVVLGFVHGITKLIYFLPKAVLASIVVVALKDLLIQLFKTFSIRKESTVDFLIYIMTLSSVILINVNYGLVIGIVFAMLSVVFRSQWAEAVCLGRVPGTPHFKGLTQYREACEVSGIKIFRFNAPIYFANAEFFTSSLYSVCGVNPILVQQKLKESLDKKLMMAKKQRKRNDIENEIFPEEKQSVLELKMHTNESEKNHSRDKSTEEQTELLTHVIIDCSTVPYIDLMGKDALIQMYKDYQTINITVFFSQCRVYVRQLFEHSNFHKIVPKKHMFVSLDEAVLYAQREQENRNECVSLILNKQEELFIAKTPRQRSTMETLENETQSLVVKNEKVIM